MFTVVVFALAVLSTVLGFVLMHRNNSYGLFVATLSIVAIGFTSPWSGSEQVCKTWDAVMRKSDNEMVYKTYLSMIGEDYTFMKKVRFKLS